jgi:hypothetical protein
VAFDYSQAKDPTDYSELIPHGTVCTVQMRIRPGGVGEDELLKRSEKGAEMLDLEFVVVDGDYARRKFWDYFVLEGITPGQQEIAKANRGKLKNILESARNIKSSDGGERARALYQADLKDFDGIIFVAKVGVKKGEPKVKDQPSGERWPDKNYLATAIGPDQKGWRLVTQPSSNNGSGNAAAATPSASAPFRNCADASTEMGELMKKGSSHQEDLTVCDRG